MKISRAVALVAHPISIAAMSAVTVLLSDKKRDLGPRLGMALPLAIGVSKVIKHVAPRHKPRILTLTPHESMPSGHSTATAAAVACVIDGTAAWRWAPLGVGVIAFVNACRVHDDEHRVSEVLTGDAIGLGAALVAGLTTRAVQRRVAARGSRPDTQPSPAAPAHSSMARFQA